MERDILESSEWSITILIFFIHELNSFAESQNSNSIHRIPLKSISSFWTISPKIEPKLILITCVLWELWVDKIRRKSPFNFRLFSFLNGNFSTATHVQHSLNSDGNIECSKNIYTNAADGLQHIGSLTNCAILEHCIIYSQFAWIFLTM